MNAWHGAASTDRRRGRNAPIARWSARRWRGAGRVNRSVVLAEREDPYALETRLRRCGGRLNKQFAPAFMGPGMVQFSNGQNPSLRANGPRERAPDDRLPEAIHCWHHKIADWISSSLRS